MLYTYTNNSACIEHCT